MTATELFTTVTDDDTPKDFRRDQWGRPSIMQPDGKRKGYTRCSSAAKTIEDTYNLERHKRRNTAYGMAYDASLVARIIAIGGAPDVWGKTEKDQVNAIIEAADAVAKAHKRADIGTAVHHLTHRLDRGEEVIGGPYQADLDAYTVAIRQAGLVTDRRYIECRLVNDALEMAGSADRIYYCPATGKYRIGDIKTGATIDFGGLGWSAQEAAYAGGKLYDVEREVRLETPEMDQNIGLIIHLPAGEGRCDIYEVDIAQGLVAARLANDIRAVRKASKTWITPVAKIALDPAPARVEGKVGDERHIDTATSPAALSDPRRQELRRRFNLLNEHDKAKFRGLMIDPNDLDLIETHLDGLDAFTNVHTEPAPPAPTIDTSNVPAQRPKVVPIPEPSLGPDVEGDPVTDAEWSVTARAFDVLDAAAKTWIKQIVAEAHTAQQWMSGAGGNKTTRRLMLLRGLVCLASSVHVDGALVRVIVDTVLDTETTGTVGQAVGSLDHIQATRFDELCQAFCAGDLEASVNPDGTMRLIPAAQAKADKQ